MNHNAVDAYLKDGGYDYHTRADLTGTPFHSPTNTHVENLKHFNVDVQNKTVSFICSAETFILYLYGTHVKTVKYLDNLAPIQLTNTYPNNLYKYPRIFKALDYWEQHHGECNVMARLVFLCHIIGCKVFVKHELYFKNMIEPVLTSTRYGTWVPTSEQLLKVHNRNEFIMHFFHSNHSLELFKHLIAIKLFQPKIDLTEFTKSCIMIRSRRSESITMVEFLCTEYPLDYGNELLSMYDSENILTGATIIRGILAHPTKCKDLLTRLLSSSNLQYEGSDYWQKRFETVLSHLRTSVFNYPEDLVLTSHIEHVRAEIIPSLWYFSQTLEVPEISLVKDFLHEGGCKFQQDIINVTTLLYETESIIEPFILTIIENVFLTQYTHARKNERKCLKQILQRVVLSFKK